MSLTDVYQPVVIKELLLHEGTRTKADLAAALAAYDLAVQEYYMRIVMRWPKITLTNTGSSTISGAVACSDFCHTRITPMHGWKPCAFAKKKIGDWQEKKKPRERAPEAGASVRYDVLKEAHGKCQLCGLSAEIRPIDIDHIIPQSKAHKNGKVRLHGRLIDVNDRENLQALCFACNRAKRDAYETDFRRRNKLVRDRIPEIIEAEGRRPLVKALFGQKLRAALFDKLTEEHAELLAAKDGVHRLEELADLAEVIFALAAEFGDDQDEFLLRVQAKRKARLLFQRAALLRRRPQSGRLTSSRLFRISS